MPKPPVWILCEQCKQSMKRRRLVHRFCSRRCAALATAPRVPRSDRFWLKVQRGPGCWLWTAAATARGYGYFDGTAAHGMAKLDDERVRTLRELRSVGISVRALAERFSISQPTVKRVVSRRGWTHVS